MRWISILFSAIGLCPFEIKPTVKAYPRSTPLDEYVRAHRGHEVDPQVLLSIL